MQSYILNLKIKIISIICLLHILLKASGDIRARKKIDITGIKRIHMHHPRGINNDNTGMIISR